MKFKKIPIEIIIAVVFNIAVLGILLIIPNKITPPMTVAVKVDISSLSLPEVKEIPKYESSESSTKTNVNNSTSQNSASSESSINESLAKNIKNLTAKHSFKNTKSSTANITSESQNRLQRKQQQLKKISEGLRYLDKINLDGSLNGDAKKNGVNLPTNHRIGSSYKSRLHGGNRKALLKKYGGDKNTEKAVNKVLQYLAKQQHDDGRWGSNESFKSTDVVALTSLSLLTFLAHGENYQSKLYGKNVKKAVDFLLTMARKENIEYAGKGFGHAIMTYALAEAFAVTGSPSIKEVLEKRLTFIISRQNKFGSFNINYDNNIQTEPTENIEVIVGEVICDLSFLGWHIQALVAAKNAGINVDGLDKSLQLATESLVKIHQAKNGGFSQGINMEKLSSNVNMNSVGLLGLQLLGNNKSRVASKAKKMVRKDGSKPTWKQGHKFPLYRWYYQTQAMFHAESGSGKYWQNWNDNLKKQLLKNQQKDGSWKMPNKDNSFTINNKDDLKIYSSSLCALMLQVYYRYLPSYNISESVKFKVADADSLAEGSRGLTTKMPGQISATAKLILGVGTKAIKPVTFGLFNGMPVNAKSKLAKDDFKIFASLSSTIQVKNASQWPQTLQPNQRIALFLDKMLPENFTGHLQLELAFMSDFDITDNDKNALEIIVNNNRVYFKKNTTEKVFTTVYIPKNYLKPFGNIVQIRNSGERTIAFDAAKLSSVNNLGRAIYLATTKPYNLPSNIRRLFKVSVIKVNSNKQLKLLKKELKLIKNYGKAPLLHVDISNISVSNLKLLAKKFASKINKWHFSGNIPQVQSNKKTFNFTEYLKTITKLNKNATITLTKNLRKATPKNSVATGAIFAESSTSLDRQAIKNISSLNHYQINSNQQQYIGKWYAYGNEGMGNNFQRDYLHKSAREIVEWFASGGNGIIIENIMSGGLYYDKLFKNELLAIEGLKRLNSAFRGKSRLLPISIYPKNSEKPLMFSHAICVANDLESVTIILTRRFDMPVEIELNTLVPWTGITTMTIDKGFLEVNSPYIGLARPRSINKKIIKIKDNNFKLSGLFPELTIITLYKGKVAKNKTVNTPVALYIPSLINADVNTARLTTPNSTLKREKFEIKSVRIPQDFTSVLGNNGSVYVTGVLPDEHDFTPPEKKSIVVNFKSKFTKNRYDSIYLSTSKTLKNAQYFSFYIKAINISKNNKNRGFMVPMRFSFGGKLYQMSLPLDRWHQVVIKLNKNNKFSQWEPLRIVQPQNINTRDINSVQYEINEIALWRDKRLAPKVHIASKVIKK